MIAVAPTDKDWFDRLRSQEHVGQVNFWTPTPWNLTRLKPGDRFYFLLKAPVRKIAGYGTFAGYENLSVSEAWSRFGTGNGVEDLDDLRARTAKYAAARAQAGAPEEADPVIGCIILDNPEFWAEEEFQDSEAMGLPVPDQVVKVKYFEKPPELSLTLLTDKEAIASAQDVLEKNFAEGASKTGEVTLGFQGGRKDSHASWVEEPNIWLALSREPGRYWNAFGTGDLFEKWKPIVVEVNPPIEGVNRRLGGAFASDGDGGIYLVHRGTVGGGRKGIGKQAFLDFYDGPQATLLDDSRSATVAVVGRLDASAFLDEVAAFVRSVEAFKEGAVQAAEPSRVWWVNQKQSYKEQRDSSSLWAPRFIKSDPPVSRKYHTDVMNTKPGDVIIHYAKGQILALSEVFAEPEEANRPSDLPTDEWEEEGLLGHTQYFELTAPIALTELSEKARLEEGGPFQSDAAVKVGYLFPLSQTFADYLRGDFAERWPAGSPWAREAVDGSLHVLLKWAPSLETDTIGEHRAIADSNGWTWWGRWGTSKTADSRVSTINDQIEAGTDTYAYLKGGDQVWRATVLHMTKERGEVDTDLLPSYYQPSDCSLFLRLSEFEELEGDWIENNLVLDRDPKNPEGVRNALRGQSSTLWVQHSGDTGMTILKVAPGRAADHWPECSQGGFISVGWDELGDLMRFKSEEELRERHAEVYAHQKNDSTITRETRELWSLRNLKPGDVVLANKGRSRILAVGTVVEPAYEWRPDKADYKNTVHVEWDEELSGPISDQGAAWRFTARPVTPSQYERILQELEHGVTAAPTPVTDLSMDWLMDNTLWEEEALEELIDVLESDGPQVVLAGPPGTGKTWVARHIARYLVNDEPGRTRTVQFHPSFGYEEFIEGLRPIARDGGIAFDVEPGIVRRMTDAIVEDGYDRVLVIDEMNRANLPRVFGELMYLFEYRDEKIDLQFTPGFHLPAGLKFVGTMNTADRSIRSIDIALRRRFDVFECPPSTDILRKFYGLDDNSNEVDDLFDGMERLNEQLVEHLDRHHTIGQTFFMSSQMTPEKLRAVWDRKLKPLIEEYFFDQPDVHKEYQLTDFWPSLGAD